MVQSKSPQRQIILVTGAAKSGKSEWAEKKAQKLQENVIYVATALENPDDPQWQAKIEQHRLRRPAHWQTYHFSHDFSEFLQTIEIPCCVLVDSLGSWVANCLDYEDTAWQILCDRLVDILPQVKVDVIVVAEETGWGVVPAYASGRLFRDRLGIMSQRLAAISDLVYLITGGYALNLTQLGEAIGNF